ncbi:hypothetical protein BDV95DRAFT_585260 [Massariosphaeria phaeospora]|uniref:Uncharacterized protein n=1 Tax=Massariosphaeria phaeospora TaxID=100035 RepID=A0A7C8M2C3_9PLEO|nr:hypothetical protein BDV95DRAFT_585260 [Massariosphaeria phaeospora]
MAVGNYQPLTLTPINFSLTDGTSIPAPPDSPPDSPRPPTPGGGPLSSHPTPVSAVFPQHRTSPSSNESSNAAVDGLHQTSTNDGASTTSPASPSTKRPASVRKWMGLRTLSSSDSLKSERPGSPATITSQPSLSRKKSGSWFGKRKSSFPVGSVPEDRESQTTYLTYTNGQATTKLAPPPQKKGPPPPALPELKSFSMSESEAEDLFKNINIK